MKKLLLTISAVAALGFISQPLAAQTATSSTSSQANNTANQISASGAIAQGGSVVLPAQPRSTTTTVRNEGSSTTRVEAAPALGGLAVGGGHPCAWTPSSAQFSIIGGGAGYGAMQVDEACMLAVMAAASGSHKMQNAALAIIAGRDPAACKAMYQQGLVADCLDRQGRSTVKAAPVVASRNRVEPTAAKLFTSCRYDQAANQIKIRYTAAGRQDKVSAGLACQRSLGM